MMSKKANTTTVAQFAYPEVVVGGKGRLTCPHCGTTGLDNFIYLEDVQNYRKLIRLKRKLLMIHSYYQVFDEGGKNPRLLCQTCDGDCAIPDNLELDWE
jgi:hypothetical protein